MNNGGAESYQEGSHNNYEYQNGNNIQLFIKSVQKMFTKFVQGYENNVKQLK